MFDVDDTLYDQTVPFREAYREYFGAEPAVPAELLYPVTRKYSDRMYSRTLDGEITMEELYIYRVKQAFEEFGVSITDREALEFQSIYGERQRHIHMSELMKEILSYCAGKAELGIITNGLSGHQWNKVKCLQAERWIPHDNIFVSGDVGVAKPDKKIFDYARHAMGLEDAGIWFVGDAYELDIKVWINRRGREKTDEIQPAYEVKSEEGLFEALKELLGEYQG